MDAKQPHPLEALLYLRRSVRQDTDCWEWTGSLQPNGYGRVRYQRKALYVHRVAAHIWAGFDLANKSFICHRCDNRRCFNPAHLFVGSQSDNMRDAAGKGRLKGLPLPRSGADHHNAKLSAADVAEIRHLYSSTGITQAELAGRFGVNRSCISRVVNGRRWKN